MLGERPVAAILAYAILATFVSFLASLMLLDIPEKNLELVREMMIALIAAFGTAYGYYLGSSEGSAKKTDAMLKPKP